MDAPILDGMKIAMIDDDNLPQSSLDALSHLNVVIAVAKHEAPGAKRLEWLYGPLL